MRPHLRNVAYYLIKFVEKYCLLLKNRKGLAQNEHALYQVRVAGVYKSSLAQVTLAGLALLGQQVALKSFITTDLSGTGYFKGLLGT